MEEARVPNLGKSVWRVTTAILTPPRTALMVTLGGPVFLARAIGWVVEHAAEEGEQQLARLNGLWSRS